MRVEDFDFELPEAQIAQEPLPERDAARLLVVDRGSGAYAHRHIRDLPLLVRRGDLLVFNDTRVIPARLLGKKIPTGGKAELLLVRPASTLATEAALAGAAGEVLWICIGQASKGLKPGNQLEFESGLAAEVVEALGEGEVRVRFHATDVQRSLAELVDRAGRVPLPPYITRPPTEADSERYQTVFARVRGSVAAPTAALHFTASLLEEIRVRGARSAFVTLDVGPGTFLPVRGEMESHRMHSERFFVPEETAVAIRETRAAGGRIIAVGTTVVRTLESATEAESGELRPGAGETSLFIVPGHRFRQVDALITNFHLPRSTLLMLVSAFAGTSNVLTAYRAAAAQGYRFFSYGDSMFIAEGAV
jgi:S-adenosylmethionine:tRNA ribosyltransferase-isomerase